MAMNFPDTPAVNDEFTVGGRTWIWTGSVWNAKVTSPISFNDLSDVAIDTPADGELLRYNESTEFWENDAVIDGGSA